MLESMNTIRWAEQDQAQRKSLLQRPVFDNTGLSGGVSEIIGRVRAGGDRALLELTERFDVWQLLDDGVLCSHSHHADGERHCDHDGKAFGDGCYRQTETNRRVVLLCIQSKWLREADLTPIVNMSCI